MWGNDEPFLKGYDLLKIPVIKDGTPTWPELFDIKKIDELRTRVGPKAFAAQMLLEPQDDRTSGRFNPERLHFYTGELKCLEANRETAFSIGDTRLLSCSCFWDPSFGGRDSDDSVISCVYKCEQNLFFLHDIEYIRCDEDEEKHSAQVQCARVVDFARRNFCPAITIETNGVGAFLPGILRDALASSGITCTVIGKHSKDNKAMRILCAFDALTAAGCLHVGDRVRNSPFVREFTEWRSDSKEHDDGMDSVAQALSNNFHRMERRPLPLTRRLSATRQFKAKRVW